jgi:hypothetical protein
MVEPGEDWVWCQRRSISSSYYALFHEFMQLVADCVVGERTTLKHVDQWTAAYRALSHAELRTACETARGAGIDNALLACTDAFARLQAQREAADYDPDFKPTQAEALICLWLSQNAIAELAAAGDVAKRALVAHLLFRKRRPRAEMDRPALQWLDRLQRT